MKRIIISLVFFVACSYADVPCSNANAVTGPGASVGTLGVPIGTLGASVGSTIMGCLTVGGPSLSPKGTADNLTGDGLWVNPATDQSNPNFQTDGLSVAWSVTNEGSGVYEYEYTFSEVKNGNNISHIIIGTGCTSVTQTGNSSGCIYDLGALSNTAGSPITPVTANISTATELLATTMPPTLTNPDLPWSTQALTVLPNTAPPNSHGYTIVFESKEAPAWENIYVRDGGESNVSGTIEAWNNSAGPGSPTLGGFYVAAPAPEAGFYILFTVFMVGLMFAIRLSRKQREQD